MNDSCLFACIGSVVVPGLAGGAGNRRDGPIRTDGSDFSDGEVAGVGDIDVVCACLDGDAGVAVKARHAIAAVFAPKTAKQSDQRSDRASGRYFANQESGLIRHIDVAGAIDSHARR